MLKVCEAGWFTDLTVGNEYQATNTSKQLVSHVEASRSNVLNNYEGKTLWLFARII